MVELDLQAQMGYDRAAVVFSPEGRIYQVEYASQAVKLGKTTVGIVFKNGVVLAAYSPKSNLQLYSKFGKVSKIDKHIGAVACGHRGDSRILIDYLRIQAQINKLTYGEPIDVFVLAKKLADRMQLYTQVGGVRPYGVSILLGGVNKESTLYEITPSGTLSKWKAKSLGRGEKEAQHYLEKKYQDNLNEEEGKKLAIATIEYSEKKFGKFNKEAIEMLVVKK